MIGVSEVTLRQWSDSGKIRVFVTPGGHRRYNINEIKSLVSSGVAAVSRSDLSTELSNNLQPHYEIGHAEMNFYQSNVKFDDRVLHQLAVEGRKTLKLLTDYINSPDDYENLLKTAEDIGNEYGEILLGANLSLPEAVQSFVSHRAPVISKIMSVLDKNESVVTEDFVDAVPHIDNLLNLSLTAMVKYYTDHI